LKKTDPMILSNATASKRQDFFILLALFAPLVILRIILLAQMKIPMGHDTLQYLQLEYTFFNEASLHGSIPQWMPFMTQGTVSNFWVMISEGILPLVATIFAPLLKGVNFLYIFEAGLLFDEFILLLGCFLLARRYLNSRLSAIFVSVSITYTAVSSTQVWWDFHLFYLVPLVLYCFDRGLREVSRKYLFLAFLLSAATLLGDLPYFAPVFAFTLFMFAITAIVASPRRFSSVAKNFIDRFSLWNLVAIIVPLIFVALIGAWYLQWQDAVVQYNTGRNAGGQTNIANFLVYAGYVGFPKFIELVTRYTNNLDNVIYGGLLVVPFALVALIKVRSRMSFAFGFTALILASLSAGSYVSALFYYLFPLGNLFREIGLLGPLIKVFLAFYAGFGFDAFVGVVRGRAARQQGSQNVHDKVVLLIPLVFVGLVIGIVGMTLSGILNLVTFPPWAFPTSSQLFVSQAEIYSALVIILLFAFSYFVILFIIANSSKHVKFILALLLIVSIVDVYTLNVQLEYNQVPQVNQNVVNLFNVYNYSFQTQRNQDYYSNSRFLAIAPFVLGGPGAAKALPDNGSQPYSTIGQWGALYWNVGSFTYFDAEASVFRTDNWLNPINSFYSLFTPTLQMDPSHVGFPIPNSTVYQEFSGYSLPKLQLFSAINVLPNEVDVADLLQSPRDTGNMLFSSANATNWSQLKGPVVQFRNTSISFNNERLNMTRLQVQQFTFDSLELLVNTGSNSSSVLYYADAWSPNWHAYVNGTETSVIRTNIGYKSVILPPGVSVVDFVYNDPLSQTVIYSIEILALVAFFSVIYIFISDVAGISILKRLDRKYA
jgi:hypothetical protein